jgi:large subunit ribosomal protein L4
MDLKIIDNKGQESGTAQFDTTLIEKKASPAVLHEVIVAYQAGQRAGTHGVKTRAEVSGGGLKPWRQKGTGNARSGSTRSPLWRKGGVIFGPVNRDYSIDLPKKKKKLAFRMAIKELFDKGRIQVVEPISLKEPKTKTVAAVYAKWKVPSDSILLVDKIESNFARASRNIQDVCVLDVESFNTYQCLGARRVFVTPAALQQLAVRIAGTSEN